MRLRELVGERRGMLVVVRRVEGDPHAKAQWLCVCDCGAECIVDGDRLSDGRVSSCPCSRKTKPRHGYANSPTYKSWEGVIQRATNPSSPSANRYVGRGITVCERWKTFTNFLADMGERPAGMSIDRIDNDRGYEPGNCRWATHGTQMTNTSATKLTAVQVNEMRGRYEHGEGPASIAVRLGIPRNTVHSVVYRNCWKHVA